MVSNVKPDSPMDRALRAVDEAPEGAGRKLSQKQLEGLRERYSTNGRDIFREMEAGKSTRVS